MSYLQSRSAAGDYKKTTKKDWLFWSTLKAQRQKFTIPQRLQEEQGELEHKPVWIQVRGGLLGHDF